MRFPSSRRWREIASTLGAAIPAERFHPRARVFLETLDEREPIAIACSGGADSVALLFVLWAAFPERRDRIAVLHFDHALRGRDSAADARFVRALARALGVTFRAEKWKRPRTARASGGHVSEAEAREARMAFFSAAMRARATHVLVLGHQLDDVAETMLMRLARGSGSAGLAAPRPLQQISDGTVRLRPLLGIRGAELRKSLRAAGAIWREDVSNAGDRFFRNRVRRHVLPQLLEASPADALVNIALSRERLEEDADALEAWLDELVGRHGKMGTETFARLRGRPRGLLRRAVNRWLAENGLLPNLTRPAVDKIVDALEGGGELEVSAGRDARVIVRDSGLACRPARERRDPAAPAPGHEGTVDVAVPGEVIRPFGDRLRARRIRVGPTLRERLAARNIDPKTTAIVAPADGWDGRFFVRARRPGDRFRPLGAPGRIKLQNLMVNRKIPPELRDRLPVVVDSTGAIVWVPGAPPAQEFAVQPDSKTVVQLTYTPATGNVP